MEIICRDSIAVIQQGIDLLSRLSQEDYTTTEPQCFSNTIGGHIRHNIDHYQCFFAGLEGRRIDYDARQRSADIEYDNQVAIAAMEALIEQFEAIDSVRLQQEIWVKMSSSAEHNSEDTYGMSSVYREMQFLLSHTIHHYAIISAMCMLKGVSVDPEFGIAPSTIKYQRLVEQNAVVNA